ncbi:MAG: hypothetical protein ACP5P9_08465 [Acidimicrobiales bacterium]
MRLDIDHEDESAFRDARGALLDRFAMWARREIGVGAEGADELAGDVGVALDWKWSYADGRLATWLPGDVAEFLLEWCPRKLSVTQADCISIPPALGAFFAFLDDEGLIGVGSSPSTELVDLLATLADEFVAAMGDRSKFGMAKSMFAAAADEGVDVSDPAELMEWMEGFNDKPDEERFRILPDSAFSGPAHRPGLPPMPLPDDDDVAASKAAAPILRMFEELAGFVGTGRKLTQTGNLTLADARVLIDVLGTDDVMDETIGGRTFTTKSAAELPRLSLVFAWAKKAGIVRVVHGKVVATKRGLALGNDPAGSFDRTVDALLAMGPLQAQRDPGGRFTWPEVNRLLDQASMHLLLAPYARQATVPIEDLSRPAADIVFDTFEFHLPNDRVEQIIATDVADIMDAFELAGVVRRDGTEQPEFGRRRSGGTVELTPAGVMTVRRILGDAGYDMPVAGRFADATAVELLLGTDKDDFQAAYGEIMAWRQRRRPEQAASEMADAVRELDDPALVNLALAVLAEIGVDVATPHVLELASDPRLRGFSLCWLVDHGQAAVEDLFDPSDPDPFVDVLAQRLVTSGPDGLVSTLAIAGDHGEQTAVIERLWRSPSQATDLVLTVIGEVHPSKVVAKAARKALFKRRSSSSGR